MTVSSAKKLRWVFLRILGRSLMYTNNKIGPNFGITPRILNIFYYNFSRRRLMLISGVLGLLLWHYFSTFPAQDDNNSGPTLHFGGGNVFEEGNSLLQRYSDAKYEILLDRLLTMEIPHRKAQERNFALKSDLGSSPKPCDIYLFEGKTERAILTNVWEDMTSYDIDDVAIVTQVDQDRLARLQPLLDHWKGTLSVAIYVDLSDTGVFIQNLVKCPSLFWRHNIDLHIVARNEAEVSYI